MYHSASNNGKLEAEMMVHSHIFRIIWKSATFFPNKWKKKNNEEKILFYQLT